MHTGLTETQKLHVLATNFYGQLPGNYSQRYWKPKKGDYYTTPRADLQLYQIVDEDDEYLYTIYCDPQMQSGFPPAKWLKTEFLEGFGVNRLYVFEYVFDL
jgi:hypothetical protein